MSKVLIIDDEVEFYEALASVLAPDLECSYAANGPEGLGRIVSESPDVVILDLVLGGGRNGLAILADILRMDPTMPVILATNHPSSETEGEALNRGAIYYVRKSADRVELLAKVEKCVQIGRKSRQCDQLLRDGLQTRSPFFCSSASMKELDGAIARIALASNTTVLITGETGVGKDVVAREIHRRSVRADRPFVSINTTAVTETLAESEFFGHVRGAFTGADAKRVGYFDVARGGTIYLNEIGDLSPRVQSKLLTAIEDRVITPVGSSEPHRIDVRVIAATHQNLDRMVREGTFRADLLGRLAVIQVRVPPFRERREDIPEMVQYFVGRYAAENGLPHICVSDEAMAMLVAHSWRKNNVRELRNTVERAIVLHGSEGTLGCAAFDLYEDVAESESSDYNIEKRRVLMNFQRKFFDRAFRQVGGSRQDHQPDHICRVAELTNLPPGTVRRKLRELADCEGAVEEPN